MADRENVAPRGLRPGMGVQVILGGLKMKTRTLSAALLLSATLLAGCGESRVPQANQPLSNPNLYGSPTTGRPTGPVTGRPTGPVTGAPTQPNSGGDYYTWYCAYDPAGCYGEYYGDYYGGGGCGSGCGGGDWYAEFYFGSQVAQH